MVASIESTINEGLLMDGLQMAGHDAVEACLSAPLPSAESLDKPEEELHGLMRIREWPESHNPTVIDAVKRKKFIHMIHRKNEAEAKAAKVRYIIHAYAQATTMSAAQYRASQLSYQANAVDEDFR